MLKNKKNVKELIYNFSSKFGIGVFRRVFPEYFAKEPLKPTDRYIEYPFVIRNLPKPPAKVLDVGCSGSCFPLLLTGFGYDVFGVDVREYAIINKMKFSNFHFIKEDIRKNYFSDNYFDAVIAISTVEHIGLFGRYGMDDDLGGDKQAVAEMKVSCWVTGLRCTEGRTRTDFKEVEERDKGLIKLNPILIWKEREVWQYLALYEVPVNPLYKEGYRSLGCAPCSHITNDDNERAGRWIGTSKCGGECGIHTQTLKLAARR